MTWLAIQEPGEAPHVVPGSKDENGERLYGRHDLSRACVCDPRLENHGGVLMVVHNEMPGDMPPEVIH